MHPNGPLPVARVPLHPESQQFSQQVEIFSTHAATCAPSTGYQEPRGIRCGCWGKKVAKQTQKFAANLSAAAVVPINRSRRPKEGRMTDHPSHPLGPLLNLRLLAESEQLREDAREARAEFQRYQTARAYDALERREVRARYRKASSRGEAG